MIVGLHYMCLHVNIVEGLPACSLAVFHDRMMHDVVSMAFSFVSAMIGRKSAHVVSIASMSAKFSWSSVLRVDCGTASAGVAKSSVALSSKALPLVVLLVADQTNLLGGGGTLAYSGALTWPSMVRIGSRTVLSAALLL